LSDYPGMKQLASVGAFSFMANYLASPDLDQAAGVFMGNIEGPCEVDCANTIPALNEFFASAVKYRAANLTLDLRRVRNVDENCVPAILEGCLQLKSLGTNVNFLEPIKCLLTVKADAAMREVYRIQEQGARY
jgi:hypothetical protein